VGLQATTLAASDSDSDKVWFGTDARGTKVWDGGIDEVALFDRALTEGEVAAPLSHRSRGDRQITMTMERKESLPTTTAAL